MHAQRIQRHRAYSTSRSSTSTQTVKKDAPDSFHLDFSFRCCSLCAESHVSLHHGQENHKGHTHLVQDPSCRASTSTHSARMSFTSTRPKLHQICFPCHGTSSAPSITPPLLRHRQTIHEGCTRTLSGSPNACALLVVVAIVLQIFASQIHRRGEVGRGKGGVSSEGS